MQDAFGRNIDYLRISVTDRCNLRCRYCMPDGIVTVPMQEILTLEEIAEVASAAASLGVQHIKLTGGEPLVRKGVISLVRMLKEIPGIRQVTMTTNGILLKDHLDELTAAGLDAVNISLDTLERKTYEQITGTDGLDAVLESVMAACESPLRVKINAVSLDLGEANIRSLIALTRDLPLDVRFIEMMPIGCGKDYPSLDHRLLRQRLEELYPGITADESFHGFGPAVYYRIPGYRGSVGLISAIHGKFCGSCNRVRLTSQGYLKTCLCYKDGADLKEILRSGLPQKERQNRLQNAMCEAVFHKPQAHSFGESRENTESAAMNAIGG